MKGGYYKLRNLFSQKLLLGVKPGELTSFRSDANQCIAAVLFFLAECIGAVRDKKMTHPDQYILKKKTVNVVNCWLKL